MRDEDGGIILTPTLLVGDVGQSQGAERTCGVVRTNVGNVLYTADYQSMVDDPNCFSMNQIFPGGYMPVFGGNITDTFLAIGTKGEINSGFLEEVSFDISGNLFCQ
ncbi:MAG: iron complex outermembrane receptor protein [Paraglaciecola sp.]|jgi:iron complex outermembrane receptor protein